MDNSIIGWVHHDISLSTWKRIHSNSVSKCIGARTFVLRERLLPHRILLVNQYRLCALEFIRGDYSTISTDQFRRWTECIFLFDLKIAWFGHCNALFGNPLFLCECKTFIKLLAYALMTSMDCCSFVCASKQSSSLLPVHATPLSCRRTLEPVSSKLDWRLWTALSSGAKRTNKWTANTTMLFSPNLFDKQAGSPTRQRQM